MINEEARLLRSALRYEEGHARRTQHILKVYALAKLFGEEEKLSDEDRQILQAAAILHDIAIKYCKEHGSGDAGQERQREAAPRLVAQFLSEANYLPAYAPKILDLVLRHHDYDHDRSRLLQLLMEADLIVNCFENPPDEKQAERIRGLFQTGGGIELLSLCLKESRKRQAPAGGDDRP